MVGHGVSVKAQPAAGRDPLRFGVQTRRLQHPLAASSTSLSPPCAMHLFSIEHDIKSNETYEEAVRKAIKRIKNAYSFFEAQVGCFHHRCLWLTDQAQELANTLRDDALETTVAGTTERNAEAIGMDCQYLGATAARGAQRVDRDQASQSPSALAASAG